MDINQLLSYKNNIEKHFELLSRSKWKFLDYNDILYIIKTDNKENKCYFKNIDDNYLYVNKFLLDGYQSSKYKFITIKYSLRNIKELYRYNKVYSNIDLLYLYTKIDLVEKDISKLKTKLNQVISAIHTLDKKKVNKL